MSLAAFTSWSSTLRLTGCTTLRLTDDITQLERALRTSLESAFQFSLAVSRAHGGRRLDHPDGAYAGMRTRTIQCGRS